MAAGNGSGHAKNSFSMFGKNNTHSITNPRLCTIGEKDIC